MNRFLPGALAALIVGGGIGASLSGIGARPLFQPTTSSGGTNTVWNAADAGAGITVSGAYPASEAHFPDTGGGNYVCIRSNNVHSYTTGKFHVEFTMDDPSDDFLILFGAGNATASLAAFAGSDTNSFSGAVQSGVLSTYYNAANIDYTTLNSTMQSFALEMDLFAKLYWLYDITNASGWTGHATNSFAGNPGAGTGGTPFASLNLSGGLMLMGCGRKPNGLKMNPGPTFLQTVSGGFSSWN